METGLHRLPVVEGTRVVGIVSSLDLLRALMPQDACSNGTVKS
jgi:CBS domain-containing protein